MREVLGPDHALTLYNPNPVLGPDHEKAAHGRQSPGPAAQYQTASSLGQQLHSKDRQAPSSSFSKASRYVTVLCAESSEASR